MVDIVLVPCANVTTGADGNTKFANSNTNGIADGTAEELTNEDGADRQRSSAP